MNKRRSEEEWFKIIEEFKASGLNLTTWCKSKRISKSSIYPYIKKFHSQNNFQETQWVSIPFTNKTDSIMFSLRVGAATLDIKNDFDKEVKGQRLAKRAIEVASSGGHNIIVVWDNIQKIT